jgi:hypothetical protein
LIVTIARVPSEADGPDALLFQLFEGARDVDFGGQPDVRNGTCRGLGGRAAECRRMSRLSYDAVYARRVARSQDRADVMRILE